MNRLTDTQLILLSQASASDHGMAVRPLGVSISVALKLSKSLLKLGLVEEIEAGVDMPVWREDGEARLALRITDNGRDAIGVCSDALDPACHSQVSSTKAPSLSDIRKADTTKTIKQRLFAKTQSLGRLWASDCKALNGDQDSQPDNELNSEASTEVVLAKRPSKVSGEDLVALSKGRRFKPKCVNGEPINDMPTPVRSSQAHISLLRAEPRAGTKQALVVDMLSSGTGVSIQDIMQATGWLSHSTRAALTGLRKKGLQIERVELSGRHALYRIGRARSAGA